MISVKKSIATRLAVGYVLLLGASFMVASAVIYFGTIGVLDRSIDGKIAAISDRLVQGYQDRPVSELLREVERQITDGIDSDTEIFLVMSPSGKRLGGNLTATPDPQFPLNQLVTGQVTRYGKLSRARIIIRRLSSGGFVVVGRDLSEQQSIRELVLRALGAGAVISVVLAVAGAALFRYQLQRRIGDIRRTAKEIEAGDLSHRIPISGNDEFGRLNADINRMLDRIQHLMEGVRHVSNAIAHDLRTPLSRIRSRLDESLRLGQTKASLLDAAESAIEGIDDLILLFDKLLRIAEAESGMRPKSFTTVDIGRIAHDMVELYDASAEEGRATLRMTGQGAVIVQGDHDLLANACASLIDNAIKYAGHGAIIEVYARDGGHIVELAVRDNGPGIPAEERSHVIERFYRLDHSRSLPGNGLGLSIVLATATLHGGMLFLEDANPGLLARIVLPAWQSTEAASVASSQSANL